LKTIKSRHVINLAKETRNSGAYAMLPQGTSQQLSDIDRPPALQDKSLELAKEAYEK